MDEGDTEKPLEVVPEGLTTQLLEPETECIAEEQSREKETVWNEKIGGICKKTQWRAQQMLSQISTSPFKFKNMDPTPKGFR